MGDTYFIKRGETINGPFTLKKLQKALSDKKLKANDQLAISNQGPWERLSSVHKDIKAGKHPFVADEEPVDAESIIDEWMEEQPAPTQPSPELREPSTHDEAYSLPSKPPEIVAEGDDDEHEVDEQPLPSSKVSPTSSDYAEEVQGEKRPSNGKPIIPFVAGGILIVAMIGIVAVFMRGGEENAAETASSEINQEKPREKTQADIIEEFKQFAPSQFELVLGYAKGIVIPMSNENGTYSWTIGAEVSDDYSIDVRKSDSLISPYVADLTVKIRYIHSNIKGRERGIAILAMRKTFTEIKDGVFTSGWGEVGLEYGYKNGQWEAQTDLKQSLMPDK
jgi:hypothetical protein